MGTLASGPCSSRLTENIKGGGHSNCQKPVSQLWGGVEWVGVDLKVQRKPSVVLSIELAWFNI